MEKRVKFGFGPGALDMIVQAGKDERHEDYSVYLTGDLCQMSTQAKSLQSRGISVKFNNAYPCVKPCDEEKVFQLIWEHKCEGWHHYIKQYEKFSICTQEQFSKVLNAQCDREREEWDRRNK